MASHEKLSVQSLIGIIDALDTYISDHLQNATTKLDIAQLLSLQRDITYYVYLFVSYQRGCQACILKSTDLSFHKKPLDDTIDFANIEILMSKPKNNTKLTIHIHKQDIGDKYCFIHRYQMFKALCIEHGYKETDMLLVFPSCTRSTLDYSVPMNYPSCSNNLTANLQLVGLFDKYKLINLNSFRTGSALHHKHIGEPIQESMHRASSLLSPSHTFTETEVKPYSNFMSKKNTDDDDEDLDFDGLGFVDGV